MNNPYDAHVGFATGEITSLIEAMTANFKILVPAGLILVAAVLGVFFLLGKGKRFVGQAR